MPTVKCPYCDRGFEWKEEMGLGRVECPHCSKTIELVRKGKKSAAETRARTTTAWGTEGFRTDEKRAEYGEIKKGDVFGGFRIEEMVGAGAMAVVYKAIQLSLDRPVALKILPKEFAKRESFVRQFDSEGDLLASLNHPNIVTIIDRGHEGDTYFFAMEYVDGTTLGEMLTSGEVGDEFFVQIMEQCAEALNYAHSKGIIHRDIKPANIMLNAQGLVKVADFGVAGLMAEAAADTSGKKKVVGTRGYMAPEQEIHVNRTDARSDIFSLGAVMYRSLTDTIPDVLPPDPVRKLNADVDPRLERIILTCLEIKPDRRYQSAKELLEALRAYHREITRAHEVCPQCKKENPVTQRTCLHCGADLSALFDVCPQCGAENRIDVDLCMSCGTGLNRVRQQTSVWISKAEESARDLLVHHRYDEAIAELGRILQVKGKVFQKARERAERLIATYREKRAAYHRERVHEGRGLAAEAKLGEALKVLESVPEEFARAQGLGPLMQDIKGRMSQAQARLAEAAELLPKRRFDEAEAVLGVVAGMWVTCPGLEEARSHLQAGRETERMVQYGLAEVKKHVESGQFAEARRALEFAMSATPDNPHLKDLLVDIDRREKAAALRNAIAGGNKAFEEGRFTEAVRYWQAACKMLPEDDERRQKLLDNVEAAKRRAVEAKEVVALEEARVVRLGEVGQAMFGGFRVRTLVLVLFGIVAAIAVMGVVVLGLALNV
jgi:serine/threonine protein kinase